MCGPGGWLWWRRGRCGQGEGGAGKGSYSMAIVAAHRECSLAAVLLDTAPHAKGEGEEVAEAEIAEANSRHKDWICSG